MSQPASELLPSSRFLRFLPLGIFVFALALRLIGIGWGLANDKHHVSYHPDEPVVWLYAQQIKPAEGKFTPGFYNYGTLYLTTLRVASDMVGAYAGKPDLNDPDSYWAFVSRCHLAGRIISALAGAGTVLFVFYMMRRFTGQVGAGFGSMLVAVAPAFVVHSRFQTVDVLATFFLAGSAYFAIKLLAEEEVRGLKTAAFAGLFAGLSMGTKYTGVLGLLTLWAALALTRKEGWVKQGLAGTAACFGVFLVTTPGALLDSAKFWQDFSYEMQHTSTGHGLVFAGTSSGYLFHFANLFVGVGWILTIMGVVGLVVAALRKNAWAIALLAFFVPYYLLIGKAEVKFVRYTFPLIIGLAAGFGWLVEEGNRRQGWGRGLVALGIAGLGGLDPGGLRGAVQFTAWMVGQDPRDAAGEFLRQVGRGQSVGLVSDPWYWTAALYKDAGLPRYVPLDVRGRLMNEARDPNVVRTDADKPDRQDWDLSLLERLKPDFVTYSSFERDPIARLMDQKPPPPEFVANIELATKFDQVLKQGYGIDRIFGTHESYVEDLEYVHPTIWVWKRKS